MQQAMKPGSMLNRPARKPSLRNNQNIDVEFERDKDAFEKHANIYRKLANEPYHHNKVRLRKEL